MSRMASRKRKTVSSFEFQPFSTKQKKLLTWWTPESPHRDKDTIICDGSIRSGKTIAMITSFVQWSLFTHQNESFIIAGKSMGALKRNVLKPMFQILSALNISYYYNRSENFIEIGSNTYYCFGANNESSQDVLQGLTAAGAYADEAVLMPRSFIEQMIGRCSVDGAKVWMNCNPGPPSHYLKTEYIDQAKEKKILRIHFTLEDNLSLSQATKERFHRMFRGVFFKRYVLGMWVLAEGLVYADYYNPERHVVSNKTIVNMIANDMFIGYGGGTDWGYTDPMTGIIFGITKQGAFYGIAEFYKTHQKTEDLANWYLKWQEMLDMKLEVIFCDSSEPDRIFTLQEHGLPAYSSDKSIMAGINSVMAAFVEDRLFFNEECTKADMEFQQYRFPNEDDKQSQRDKDLPVDDNNHLMDAIRYFIHNYVKVYKTKERRKNRSRDRKGKKKIFG